MSLLSVQWQGFGWCLLLLVIVVCVIRLARRLLDSFRARFQKPPPAPPAPEKGTEKQEPVYFLVERKKKRPKKAYSEPKEIVFR